MALVYQNSKDPLSSTEVHALLTNPVETLISSPANPPMFPRSGDIYLYKVRSRNDLDNIRKDGWSWRQNGSTSFGSGGRTYFKIRLPDNVLSKEFQKTFSYLGGSLNAPVGGVVLVQYTGDDKVARASKQTKQGHSFRPLSRAVDEAVIQDALRTKPTKLIKRILANHEGGPKLYVDAPYSAAAIKYRQQKLKKDLRPSQDDLYNIVEFLYNVGFVRRITIEENDTNIIAVSDQMLELYAKIVSSCSKSGDQAVHLGYDTTYNLNDQFLVSVLTVKNTLLVQEPVMFVAALIHRKRTISVHTDFFRYLKEKFPLFDTARQILSIDREFANSEFVSVFSNTHYAYCLVHLRANLETQCRDMKDVEQTDLRNILADFDELKVLPSRECFEKRYETIKRGGWWKPQVVQYFEQHLMNDFLNHSSQWVLRRWHCSDPTMLITNNGNESLNKVLKELNQWEIVPVDVLAFALYNFQELEAYEKGVLCMHNVGRFTLKQRYFGEHGKKPSELKMKDSKFLEHDDMVKAIREGTVYETAKDALAITQCQPKSRDNQRLTTRALGAKLAANGRVLEVEEFDSNWVLFPFTPTITSQR